MTDPQNTFSPVILGAGPAGLGLAYRLTESGVRSLVLEKETFVGGLGATVQSDGYFFDFGPHLLHPKDPDIAAFFKRIMGADLLSPVTTRQILSRGRYVNYPIRGLRVLTSLSPWLAFLATIDFIRTRATLFVYKPRREESFEAWVQNRFGPILYGIYFGPYVEKVWKTPGSELSRYVAEKRIPVVSIRDQVRDWLHRRPRMVHEEDGSLEQFYCRKGTGQLFDVLREKVLQAGTRIETGVEILSLRMDGARVSSVTWRRDGKTEVTQPDVVVSTLPLSSLIRLLGPDVPQAVQTAASKLDYCAERFLYVKIRNPDVGIPALLYFSEPGVRFNRISNIGLFSPECVPKGRSALCIEFTCNVGDDIWNADDQTLFAEAREVLVRNGLVKAEEFEGFLTRRVPHAYPRFRIGFQEHLAIVQKFVGGITNLRSLGRHGGFNYANIDEVLKSAFTACDEILRAHPHR